MFNGNLDKIISYCESIGADYLVSEIPSGSRLVYVEEKKNHLKQNEFRSYLRISKHEDHEYFYTKQDGMVGYKTDEWIKNWIDYLTFGGKRALTEDEKFELECDEDCFVR